MDSDLQRRARRAYEWGRARVAAPWAVPALVLAAVTWALAGTLVAWPLGVALAAVLVGLTWRGEALGRAVLPGLSAGLLGWAVPMAWLCGDGVCTADCSAVCAAVAAVGGGAGGLLLWRQVGSTSAIAALSVAALCASMGCIALGTSGLVGVLAILVVGAPTAVRTPAAA